MPHRSYHLELTSPADFRPKEFPATGPQLRQATAEEGARCRRLWVEVGRGFWSEREDWMDVRWRSHLEGDAVEFWIATDGGEDCGFFELTTGEAGVFIAGIGFLPPWRGRGLGGGLLTAAVRRAIACGATRVWLHTATDDHPGALPNYLARGFRIYRDEPLENPMPGR